jgi:hypothetical protein
MTVLPDFDAPGLWKGMMFEKAKPFNASRDAAAAPRSDDHARLRAGVPGAGQGRPAPRPARRAGDALRAMEWSELTARLNAARDLRLLLRSESQAPIEGHAASFGDAAASYFALLDDGSGDVDRAALGQSKGSAAMVTVGKATRPRETTGSHADNPRGDARDTR